MADAIRVNGNQLSWGSIRLVLDIETFTGFTAISYADKRERVKAWGMGRHQAPRGRSSGKYTPDPVKLTGWKDSVQAFIAGLAQRAPDQTSYGNVEFTISVLYSELPLPPTQVLITGCVIVGQSSSEEEGADPLKEELEIDCMAIRRNGLTLFDNTELAPV